MDDAELKENFDFSKLARQQLEQGQDNLLVNMKEELPYLRTILIGGVIHATKWPRAQLSVRVQGYDLVVQVMVPEYEVQATLRGTDLDIVLSSLNDHLAANHVPWEPTYKALQRERSQKRKGR